MRREIGEIGVFFLGGGVALGCYVCSSWRGGACIGVLRFVLCVWWIDLRFWDFRNCGRGVCAIIMGG